MADVSYTLPQPLKEGVRKIVVTHMEEVDREFVFVVVVLGEAQVVVTQPCWSDRRALGVWFSARQVQGSWVLTAIRDGMAASDDEVVAQLQVWGDGDSLWIVPPVPTPRGLVIMKAIRALQESFGDVPVLECQTSDDGITRTDDADLTALNGSTVQSARLRSWSKGKFTLLHLDGESGDRGALCTLIADDEIHDIVVGRSGGVTHTAHHPSVCPRSWEGDASVLALAEVVSREIAVT